MISVNERDYPNSFKTTAVVICLDGSQKEYLDEASKLDLTPNLDRITKAGEYLMVHSAIPSFTNPNNISIRLYLSRQTPARQCSPCSAATYTVRAFSPLA